MNSIRLQMFAAACATPVTSALACALVDVQNVRPAQGSLMVAVYADEADFPRKPAIALQQRAGEGETLRFAVCGYDGREVALSLFQDLNDNRRMDSNLVGMPTEPYGASSASGAPLMGPPSWAATKVTLKSGAEAAPLVISLSK